MKASELKLKPISTNRAEEIGWMHQVFEDDTLMSAEERHAYKKQIIDREMKDRNHGLLEFAEAIVGLGEIAFIGGVTKSMVGIAREVKLLQALRAGRPHVFDAFNKTPATSTQLEKLGIKIARENFKVDWKNPDVMSRGYQYEGFVVEELAPQGFARLAPNTNTFDAFNPITGHALSIKSINTQTPARLADPRQIEHLLNSYVRKVKGFEGIKPTQTQKFKVTKNDVRSSEIRIGVPKETTLEQWLVMQKSALKAEQQGIKLLMELKNE